MVIKLMKVWIVIISENGNVWDAFIKDTEMNKLLCRDHS
jgi:hypothetical protein